MTHLDDFEDILQRAKVKELAERLLVWACHDKVGFNVALGSKLPHFCTIASIFGKYCSPADADDSCLDIATRLVLICFAIDGFDQAAIVEDDGTEVLIAGPFAKGIANWHDGFAELKEGSRFARDRFAASFQAYLKARKAEPIDRAESISIEEHFASRRKTVFVEPFVLFWSIRRKFDLCSLDQDLIDSLITQAADLVWLSNDIASVGSVRDNETEDLCIFNTIRANRGCGEDEAYDEVIETYTKTAAFFVRSANAVLSAAGRPVETFIDILAVGIDGNLRTMELSPFRYCRLPEIERLPRVTGQLNFSSLETA